MQYKYKFSLIAVVITMFNELHSMNQLNKNDEANTTTPNNNNGVLVSGSDHSTNIEILYLQQNSANTAYLKQSME